jgi:hypothetical protein
MKLTPLRSLVIVLVALAHSHAMAVDTSAQAKFGRPEDAMRALVAAVRAGDHAKVVAILGPESEDLLSSGDPIDDKTTGRLFAERATARTRIEILDSERRSPTSGRTTGPSRFPHQRRRRMALRHRRRT